MIYKMGTERLFCFHVNPVNPVHYPFSACGAHWPEMALQFHDLMKTSVNFLFGADQLSERDLRQRILYYLMQSDYYRPDTTVARVNTNIQHACVRFAEVGHRVFVENADHFVQPNL